MLWLVTWSAVVGFAMAPQPIHWVNDLSVALALTSAFELLRRSASCWSRCQRNRKGKVTREFYLEDEKGTEQQAGNDRQGQRNWSRNQCSACLKLPTSIPRRSSGLERL